MNRTEIKSPSEAGCGGGGGVWCTILGHHVSCVTSNVSVLSLCWISIFCIIISGYWGGAGVNIHNSTLNVQYLLGGWSGFDIVFVGVK